jgi:SOS-response transcriptional repressor LexA
MREPTAKQSAVLAILREHQAAGRPCPTYEEIGKRMGISRQSVARHLAALERKGHIARDPAVHRAISINSAISQWEGAKSHPTANLPNRPIL